MKSKATFISFVVVTVIIIASVEGCSSNKQFVSKNLATYSSVEVMRYETPRIRLIGTASAAGFLLGGPIALYFASAAETSKFREQLTEPDFGELLIDRFVQQVQENIPDFPQLSVNKKPISGDSPSSRSTILIFKVNDVAISLDELVVPTTVVMQDYAKVVLWEKNYTYVSGKFNRKVDVDEMKAGNLKQLNAEMEFAAERTVTDFISHFNEGRGKAYQFAEKVTDVDKTYKKEQVPSQSTGIALSESLPGHSEVKPPPVTPAMQAPEPATSVVSELSNVPPPAQAKVSLAKRYPAPSTTLTMLPAPTFPPKGTKYSYTVKRLGKKWTDRYVVLGEGVYDGRRVHQVKLEGKDGLVLYDMETGNWMRTVIEGSTVGSAKPYEDIFRYPLEVGKKHRSEFYYFDHVTSGNTRATVTIASLKDVEVPAGPFKAYQIVAWESSAIAGASYGSTWWRKKTLWYSPDLKIVVKIVDTDLRDSISTVTELLEYYEP